ncbi:MAG TPA: type I-E CRISPR-associated protein Cas5/CasD [Syntrophobacteraceae bacterium]|nr:type I-E CRISPR-associated protein Cas5/CasD [Syntrophobacteraceae bacterium]
MTTDYLILKLQGPMQAWGGHSYENTRPTEYFPTRSGIVGLLAACLGIERARHASLRDLSESFSFAVRADQHLDEMGLASGALTDFHTVQNVPQVAGGTRTIVTHRQYLCDLSFTVALRFHQQGRYQMKEVLEAVSKPLYTPYLGRKSCPLARPLFECVVKGADFLDALSNVEPREGLVYSEDNLGSVNILHVRDVPFFERRRFGTREVYVHYMQKEGLSDVSQ